MIADPSELRARTRRPPGWVAPGPAPLGAQGRPDLTPAPDEDLSYLTGDWRIFQHKRGHRWSLDDFVTALVALEEAEAHGRVARALDMGCGIGSVLMMVAWGLPEVRSVGIEAQDVSQGFARRSLAYNGAADRCEVRHGDLRDPAMLPEGAVFDLVTGTPPYLPEGHGLISEKVQRGPCCFELRGGVEDYALAAARALAPGGRFVVCAGVRPDRRLEPAIRAAGLVPYRTVEVVPRDGKEVLFEVQAAARPEDAPPPRPTESFVVRDRDERLTEAMHQARARLGMPPAARS